MKQRVKYLLITILKNYLENLTQIFAWHTHVRAEGE